MNGFTEIRTVRALSGVVAILGMFSLFIQRVLTYALNLANEALAMALTRYNGFTGRLASKFFDEDKKILAFVEDVQQLMPTFETLLTVLLVFSIIVILVAVLGLALPRQFSHLLVALRILKWQPAPVQEYKPME